MSNCCYISRYRNLYCTAASYLYENPEVSPPLIYIAREEGNKVSFYLNDIVFPRQTY